MKPARVDEITEKYIDGMIVKIKFKIAKEEKYSLDSLNINQYTVIDFLSLNKKDLIKMMDKLTKKINDRTTKFKKDLEDVKDELTAKTLRANVLLNLTFQTTQYSQLLQQYKAIWSLVENVKGATEEAVIKQYEEAGKENDIEAYNQNESLGTNMYSKLSNIQDLLKEDVVKAIDDSLEERKELKDKVRKILQQHKHLDYFSTVSNLENLQPRSLTQTTSFIEKLCFLEDTGLKYDSNNWALKTIIDGVLELNITDEHVNQITPLISTLDGKSLLECGDSLDALALLLGLNFDKKNVKRILDLSKVKINNGEDVYDVLYNIVGLYTSIFGKYSTDTFKTLNGRIASSVKKGNPLNISSYNAFITHQYDDAYHMDMVKGFYTAYYEVFNHKNTLLNGEQVTIDNLLIEMIKHVVKLLPNADPDKLERMYTKNNYLTLQGKGSTIAIDTESKEYKHIYSLAIEEFGTITEDFVYRYGELPRGPLSPSVHESLCKRYAGVYHQLRDSAESFQTHLMKIGNYGYGDKIPIQIVRGLLILSNAIRRDEIPKGSKGFYPKALDRVTAYIKDTGTYIEDSKPETLKKPKATPNNDNHATYNSPMIESIKTVVDISELNASQLEELSDAFYKVEGTLTKEVSKKLFPALKLKLSLTKQNIKAICANIVKEEFLINKLGGDFTNIVSFMNSKGSVEKVVSLVVLDLVVDGNSKSYVTIDDMDDETSTTLAIYGDILLVQLGEFGGYSTKESKQTFMKNYNSAKDMKSIVMILNNLIAKKGTIQIERVAENILRSTLESKDDMKVLKESPNGKKVIKEFETILGQRGKVSKEENEKAVYHLDEVVETDIGDLPKSVISLQNMYFEEMYSELNKSILTVMNKAERGDLPETGFRGDLSYNIGKKLKLQPILNENVIVQGTYLDINRLVKYFPKLVKGRVTGDINNSNALEETLNTLYKTLTEGVYSNYFNNTLTNISYDIEKSGYKMELEEKQVKALSVIKVIREMNTEPTPNTMEDVMPFIRGVIKPKNYVASELKSLGMIFNAVKNSLTDDELLLIPSIIGYVDVFDVLHNGVMDNLEKIFSDYIKGQSAPPSIFKIKHAHYKYISNIRKYYDREVYKPLRSALDNVYPESETRPKIDLNNIESKMRHMIDTVRTGGQL